MQHESIRDVARESRIFRTRLIVASFIVALLFLTLVARLVFLQVVDHRHFSTLSEQNRITVVPIPPARGMIYDRNGVLLAQNFSVYTLEIVPDQVEDMDELLRNLSYIVELSDYDIKRFNKRRRQRPGFESILLRTHLSDEEAARFAVNQHRFPGAELKARLQRHYPLGRLTAHVVGYVGRISERDIKRMDPKVFQSRYRGTEYIGKTGVERSYEEILHGIPGYEQVETNAHGRKLRVIQTVRPIPGKNLYLNIDVRLQKTGEEALGDFNGAVVAIDPGTGGVLALVSKPSYDPNPFINGIGFKPYAELRDSPDRPLVNRALNGRYPPGSTIKPFMALVGMQEGINRNAKTFCPGYFRLGNAKHKYRCWKKSGHGPVNASRAITESCDVYFYTLAHKLGIDTLHREMTSFGFGQKTQIDLPSESAGLYPSREWKRKARKQVWYPGETVISGIGQGFILVTPLQLANATAAIVHDGLEYKPRVVFAIQDPITGKMEKLEPEVLRQAENNKKKDYAYVRDAMHNVVHGRGGTARRIAVGAKYEMAGKTGTAQVVGVAQGARYNEKALARKHWDHGLFISFAPYGDPKIAVAVVAEHGRHGGSGAAPVARAVMDTYLLPEEEPAEETNEEAAGTPTETKKQENAQ